MSLLLNDPRIMLERAHAADSPPAPRPGRWARVRARVRAMFARAPGPDNGEIMPILRSGADSQWRLRRAQAMARASIDDRTRRHMDPMTALRLENQLTESYRRRLP